MKLRPSRLQTSSGGEANATPDRNAKKKLGELWRKAKMEAQAISSPRAKATRMEAISPRATAMTKSPRASTKTTKSASATPNTSVAPPALAAVESPRGKPNPENRVRTPSNAVKGDSQSSKVKLTPKEENPNAPLKHRLPKDDPTAALKHRLQKDDPTAPLKHRLQKDDANAPLKHKLPKKQSKRRPKVIVTTTEQQHETKTPEVKVPDAKASQTTAPVHNTPEIKKVPLVKPVVPPVDISAPPVGKSNTEKQQAPPVTGMPPRTPSTTSGTSSTPNKPKTPSDSSSNSSKSSEITCALSNKDPKNLTLTLSSTNNNSNRLTAAPKTPHTASSSSKRNKASRTNITKERSSKKQYLVEMAIKEEEAVSAASAAMTMAAAKKEARKKKSALQQFREEEAAKAKEMARITKDIREAEIARGWADQKNGRGCLMGEMTGLICNTGMDQVDDPEGGIMTPRASNATPKSVKKDLFAQGELGDEGFEVNKKAKASSKATKSQKQATEDDNTATESANAVPDQASPTKTAAKSKKSAKSNKPQKNKVTATSAEQASVSSNKPTSKAKEERAPDAARALALQLQSPVKKSNSANASSNENPTSSPTSNNKSKVNKPQKNKVNQASVTSNKPASEAREEKSPNAAQSPVKTSADASSKANPTSSPKSNNKPKSKMSPKSKNRMRRQKLATNSLTDFEADGNFPDTGVYLTPKYGCFGSEAIIPYTTSSESGSAFAFPASPLSAAGDELVREASNAIGEVLNIDPYNVKAGIERMALTPMSAAGRLLTENVDASASHKSFFSGRSTAGKMDIDRVIITENDAASPKGYFLGMNNFFRPRNGGKHGQIEKVDSIFDDIDDYNPPCSPVHRSIGFCNATAWGDLIFGADEVIVEGEDGEFRIRNVASVCRSNSGEEIIEVQTIPSDIVDMSDTDLEEDVLEALDEEDENTQYGSDTDFEEETALKIDSYTSFETALKIDSYTSFGGETSAPDEEEYAQLSVYDDYETGTDTEESGSEDESEIDFDTDFDSESATTDSTASKSLDDNVEELSEMITFDTPVRGASFARSERSKQRTAVPKRLAPTPIWVNSPISVHRERSLAGANVDGTPTLETSYSFSNRKPSIKLISSLFKRTFSNVSKKSVNEKTQSIGATGVRDHSEQAFDGDIDCDIGELAQEGEGTDAIKEGVDCTQETVDIPYEVAETIPAQEETLTKPGKGGVSQHEDAVKQHEEEDSRVVKPVASSSFLLKTSPNVEANCSEVVSLAADADASEKDSMTGCVEEISQVPNEKELPFSTTSDADPVLSQELSNETSESYEEGHEVDHASFVASISQTSTESQDNEDHASFVACISQTILTESQDKSAADEVSDNNSPTGEPLAKSPMEATSAELKIKDKESPDDLSQESRQDASMHGNAYDSLREDSCAHREDSTLKKNSAEEKEQSFDWSDSLDRSKSDILSPTTTDGGTEIRPPGKGHSRKVGKVGSFLAARSSKLEKQPLLAENE